MLKIIRGFANTWIVKLLLGLLVVAFASWGVADVFTSVGKSSVARVAGVDISQGQFTQEFQNELTSQSQSGQKMSVADALTLGLDQTVLNRLVFQQIISQAAADAGVHMPDDAVIDDIRNIQAFQSAAGFDEFAFKSYLSRANMSEAQFVDIMREDATRRTLIEAMLGPIAVPASETDFYYRYQTEKRDADFFQVAADRMKVDAPSDADVKTYYDQHNAAFMAPEYRSFTVLSLLPADLEAQITVSDADLKSAYEQSRNLYNKPEKRTVAQIVVQSEDQANALSKKIAGGESFADAAKEAGKSAADTTLGDMTQDDLTAINADLAKAAFATDKPGVVGPIKSPFGWHLVNVSKIEPGSTQPLDEVKEKLRADIVKDRAKDMMFDLSSKVQDALASGSTLEEAASEFKGKLASVMSIDKAGMTEEGKDAVGLPQQKVIDQAFAIQPGAYPEVKPLDDGSFFVARVDAVTPAVLKPLDSVKDMARQDLLNERMQTAAKDMAGKLKDRAAKGEDFAALAKEAGGEVYHAQGIGRGGAGAPPILGSDAITALFDAHKNAPFAAPTSAGGDYVVARMTNAVTGDPKIDTAGRTQMQNVLSQVFQNNILEQFRLALLQKYDVKLYPDVARRTVSSDQSF